MLVVSARIIISFQRHALYFPHKYAEMAGIGGTVVVIYGFRETAASRSSLILKLQSV